MTRAIGGILLAALLCAAARGGEDAKARALMDKYAATLPADEEVEMRLDIYRRVGLAKVDLDKPRISVTLKRAIRGAGAAARVRIDVMKPEIMAGIALTARWDAKLRKPEVVRFLPGSNSLGRMGYLSTPFMQSHIRYEDVVPLAVGEFSYATKGAKKVGGADCHVVEAAPKRPSAYVKLVYYLRKGDGRAAKVEYWGRGYRGAELLKTRIFKRNGGEEWIAARTGEKTVVTFSQRRSEAPDAERYLPESLRSNPSLVRLMKERAKLLEEEDRLRRELAQLEAALAKEKSAAAAHASRLSARGE